MTLKADSDRLGDWVVNGNSFDASRTVDVSGSAPSSSRRMFPFEIRNTSLAAGFSMQLNDVVVNSASSHVKFGASSGNDLIHGPDPAAVLRVVCPAAQRPVDVLPERAGTSVAVARVSC